MSLESVTANGRLAAEARMVDACTITRPTAGETFDQNTGTYTTAATEVIYSGACEVQISDGLNARDDVVGASDVTLTRLTVKIPVSATGPRIDDLVTITSAQLDAELLGQRYAVISGHAKSFATARRLQVQQVTA